MNYIPSFISIPLTSLVDLIPKPIVFLFEKDEIEEEYTPLTYKNFNKVNKSIVPIKKSKKKRLF